MLGERNVEIVERPQPSLEDGDVLVRVRASAICGSERQSYRDGASFNRGHEACGEVVEARSPRRVRVGQKVIPYAAIFCGHCPECLSGRAIMCRNIQCHDGYHTEYISVPEQCLLTLPYDVPFDLGALMSDAFGTPYRAIKRLAVDGSHTVAVFGLGPIGLAAVLICRWTGARVIAMEVNRYRLHLGHELGADEVIDASAANPVLAVTELTDGQGADIALDCSGSATAETAAIECTKKGGKVAFIGNNHGSIPISPSEHLIRKELTLIGSCYFGLNDYGEMLQLMRSGLPLARIITHHFHLDDAQEAFDVFMSGNAGKVILEY